MTMPPPPPGHGPIDPSGAFGRPPMPTMPPMMPMFLPPPAPRGRWGSAILTTFATTIFGLSILLNIYLLIYSGLLAKSTEFEKTTVVNGSSTEQIAAIPISGLIDDAAAEKLEKTLKEIENEPIKALVLEIDSPGGGVTASDQMYADVLRFKAKKQIPVVVSMGSVAASGGYYISCAADKIVAQRTTVTGSIGVLMPRYDLTELGQKYGVHDDSLISTGATFKNVGSPLQPLKPEDRAYLTGIIDSMFSTFKATVVKGRGANLKQPIDQIAVGKAFTGEEALKLGLVDQLGYQPDAYAVAASLAGNLINPEVVRVTPSTSILQSLTSSRSHVTGVQSLSGVNINVDSNILDRLMSSKPQYLWRGN